MVQLNCPFAQYPLHTFAIPKIQGLQELSFENTGDFGENTGHHVTDLIIAHHALAKVGPTTVG